MVRVRTSLRAARHIKASGVWAKSTVTVFKSIMTDFTTDSGSITNRVAKVRMCREIKGSDQCTKGSGLEGSNMGRER